jgi:hypothetical protein
LVLFFVNNILAKKNDTDHHNNDTDTNDLGKRTAELKKQAFKLMELRGINVTYNDSSIKPVARWDDIKMTEDLYHDIKNGFDAEQKLLEANNETDRTTAPDFNLIPLAKWSMPIEYTLNYIKSNSLKPIIRDALNEIQTKTGCIKFSLVDSTPEHSHIQFTEVNSLGDGVCAESPLGKQSIVNEINVATTCQRYGSLIHETLHSLGFAHTQQRPDFDQYITVNWNNIKTSPPDLKANFYPWPYALKNQGPFDYSSIMMYPTTAFAKQGTETLIPKRDAAKNRLLMGQRDHLSTEDVNILKKIYCAATSGGSGTGGGTIINSSNCKDKSRSCAYWTSRGYCNKSSNFYAYVSDQCQHTCKVC